MEAEQSTTLPCIGLVATDEVLIEGLRAILGLELVLLSEARREEMASFDLVLIDSHATDHLVELLEEFRRLRPFMRLLVLGGNDRAEFIENVITAGARGVLSHDASDAELRMAVQVVRDGSVWAPRKVLSRLLDRAKAPLAPAVHLTFRELEVLRLLLRGLSNREIADALAVEQATVKAHLGRLMRKAGVRNRTALGMHAHESKWA